MTDWLQTPTGKYCIPNTKVLLFQLLLLRFARSMFTIFRIHQPPIFSADYTPEERLWCELVRHGERLEWHRCQCREYIIRQQQQQHSQLGAGKLCGEQRKVVLPGTRSVRPAKRWWVRGWWIVLLWHVAMLRYQQRVHNGFYFVLHTRVRR